MKINDKKPAPLVAPKQVTTAKAAPPARAVSEKFKKDELSTGVGGALRRRAASALAAQPRPAAQSQQVKGLSLAQVLAAQKSGAPLMQAQAPARYGPFAAKGGELSGVRRTGGTTPPSPAEQARADAAEVQRTYDAAIANGDSPAEAAQAASAQMADFANAHEGDPAYVNTLVRESQALIDTMCTTLGENASDKEYGGGDDKKAIKETVGNLSEVASAGGPVTASILGTALASHLPNDGQLWHVDDGFYDHVGDDGSPLLFQATEAALRAQGKNKAADGLHDNEHEDHGLGIPGPFDDWAVAGAEEVIDFAGDVAGVIGDGLGTVVGFGADVVGGVVHVVAEAGEFAVDTVKGTVNLVGDAASWTADQVKEAATWAAEQGLELAEGLQQRAHQMALDGLESVLDVGGHIAQLGDHESWTIGGEGNVQVGVGVGVSGDVTVTNNGDGTYEITAELDASIAGEFLGELTGGLGGKVTFTADSPEEAKRIALELAAIGAALAAPDPVSKAILLPLNGDSFNTLKENISSIEVTGSLSVSAELEAAFGVAEIGASAEVGVETGYRVDFENGEPSALVRITTVEGEVAASLGMQLLDDAGEQFGTLAGGSANVNASITVETSIPINGGSISSLPAFLASPMTAVVANAATTTVHLEAEGQASALGQGGGWHAELDISDIDGSEAQSVVKQLLAGNLRNAFAGVEVETHSTTYTFVDSDGSPIPDINLDLGPVELELETHATMRDVTNYRES